MPLFEVPLTFALLGGGGNTAAALKIAVLTVLVAAILYTRLGPPRR